MAFDEKRKAKRLPIDLFLGISELFKQDNEIIKNVNAPIEVVDISRGGIGFITESDLPLDFYFNSRIQISNDKDSFFYCVVKIIRKSEYHDGRFIYGCEFVGFPPVLNYMFDEFESRMRERSLLTDEELKSAQ